MVESGPIVAQILQGDFVMTVSVVDGNLSFQVFDQETGDLYPQVHNGKHDRKFCCKCP